MLAWCVAVASTLAGCCETAHHTVAVNANGEALSEGAVDVGSIGVEALDCSRLCVRPIAGRCNGWVIDACERADPEGHTITCHYVDTECRDIVPVPRSQCGLRRGGEDGARAACGATSRRDHAPRGVL